jgi:predicted small metal-binding protein
LTKEVITMDKVFRCRDLGLDCAAVIRAGTEEEILKQAAEHASAVHDMQEVPPEVVVKVRAAIQEE